MERRRGAWTKALEGNTTEREMLFSAKNNLIEITAQRKAWDNSFDLPSNLRRKKGWNAGIHWDLLH
jgi:hypothetical protein